MQYQTLNQEERCALWSRADVLIKTNLRNGLSLYPFEFVSVKHLQNKLNKSAVIMSEFSGCARNMFGVHLINPYDID